jgi:hypothetical protein
VYRVVRQAHRRRVPVPSKSSQSDIFPLVAAIRTLLAGLTFGAYHSGLFFRSISKRLYESLDSLSASSVFEWEV